MAAYAFTPTYKARCINGRRVLLLQIAETVLAAGDEWHVDLGEYLPDGLWKIVRYKLVESSGTAATYAPVFGTATNPTAGTIDYVGGLVAAASQDSTNSAAGWVGAGHTLYGRSVPNAGADNVVTTQIMLVEGWHA